MSEQFLICELRHVICTRKGHHCFNTYFWHNIITSFSSTEKNQISLHLFKEIVFQLVKQIQITLILFQFVKKISVQVQQSIEKNDLTLFLYFWGKIVSDQNNQKFLKNII